MRHIGTKPLETERLALRRFRMADAGDIFANWAADPEVTRFLKIHSHHHRDNPASGRVMQKCGMTCIKAEYRAMDSKQLSGEYLYYEVEKTNNIPGRPPTAHKIR